MTVEEQTRSARPVEQGERKRLEAALHDARCEMAKLQRELDAATAQARHLSSIFERAPVAIFVKNLEGRYLDANPTAAAVLGRTLDDLVSMTDEELFGAAVANEIRDIDQHVVTSSRPFRYEARRMTPEGERVFQTTKWPWMSETKETIGIIAMSREVTDAVYAQEYYALQSAISGVLLRAKSLQETWPVLLQAIGSALAAEVMFLWKYEDGEQLVPVARHSVRPAFAADLVDASTEAEGPTSSWLGDAESEGEPMVRSTGEGDRRLEIARAAGLLTAFAIPVAGPEGRFIIEGFCTERRTGTRRLIENLAEAGRRISGRPLPSR